MRDLIVTAIFVFGAVHALRNPYYGALLWVWIGLMNPHRLGWGFAYDLPFAMAAVVVVGLGILFSRKSFRWMGGTPTLLLLLLLVWMTLTSAMSIMPEATWTKYTEVLKVLGMAIVVGCLVTTREQIIGLIWFVAGSIAYFGVKGGVFTLMHAGAFRVWGPPSSVVEGNNELAVALIVTIPFLYFLARHVAVAREFVLVRRIPEVWLRRGLYLCMLLCAVSALGSHSRGALLAIVAMTGMLWWRSRAKFSLGVLIVLLAPLGLMMMPEEWFGRMNTIKTYEEDMSAMGRVNAWQTAINIANDRIFGAGFATATPLVFSLYSPQPDWVLVAHSIYFQVLGDHGYVGLAIYLAFWFATYRLAGRVVQLGRSSPEHAWAVELANMAKVSMVGFAVGGAFLSLAYWDMPFYIMVILVVTERHVREAIAAAPVVDTLVTSVEVPGGRRSGIT